EPLDKTDLRLPALRLEPALADVVVTCRTREREVIRQQEVDRTPVRLLPCRVPPPEDLLIGRDLSGLRGTSLSVCQSGRSDQRTGSRAEHVPTRHCYPRHVPFSFRDFIRYGASLPCRRCVAGSVVTLRAR